MRRNQLSDAWGREPAAPQSAEWWNLVAQLRDGEAKVREVLARLAQQESAARSNPSLSGEYDAIMSRARSLQATISSYLSAAGAAVDWVKDAAASVKSAFGFEGLGIVPVVLGGAAIAVALALVTKFLADAWALSKRLDEQVRLEGQGLTPQQASAVVYRTTGDSAASSWLKQLLPVLGIGVAAWFAIDHYTGGRRG